MLSLFTLLDGSVSAVDLRAAREIDRSGREGSDSGPCLRVREGYVAVTVRFLFCGPIQFRHCGPLSLVGYLLLFQSVHGGSRNSQRHNSP